MILFNSYLDTHVLRTTRKAILAVKKGQARTSVALNVPMCRPETCTPRSRCDVDNS